MTFTDRTRVIFKGVLEKVAGFLNRLGLTPNAITLLGLVGNVAGAVLIGMGHMTIGGLIVLAMGAADALDGTMARLRGMSTVYGAFIDSVADRYSELVVFAGLIYYYLSQGEWLLAMVTYAAASGSVLVSYIRARAASVGMDTKVGILTRFERYLILSPALVFNIPWLAVWILAIFANLTALQRIIDVRRQWRGRSGG